MTDVLDQVDDAATSPAEGATVWVPTARPPVLNAIAAAGLNASEEAAGATLAVLSTRLTRHRLGEFVTVARDLSLPVVVLVGWWVWSAGAAEPFFPPLQEILTRFREMWLFDQFVSDVLPSLRNMAVGFGIASVVGVAVGLLLARVRLLREALEPLMHGGGQEGHIRSGTLSPALCAGFGAAAALAEERREADGRHVARLRDAALAKLQGWTINGDIQRRYPGNLNVRRPGLDAARLIADVRGVAFSAGSACASGSGRPSHVLKAIGLSDADARSSIRLGFGRYTTETELAQALDLIVEAAERQQVTA